jgi:hypothetical protein
MPRQTIFLPLDEVLRRYENGESSVELGEAYNCSPSTVMKAINEAKAAPALTLPIVCDESGYYIDAVGNRWTRSELLRYLKSERARELAKRADKIEQEDKAFLTHARQSRERKQARRKQLVMEAA